MLVAELAEFGEPEKVVRLKEQPDPGEPGAGEVVIDAELAPINPSDLLNMQGLYGAQRPKLPMVPGNEGIGRVVKCGAGVNQVKAGDRVLLPTPGAWQQRFKVNAKGLFALPAGVDQEQLAMLRVNPPTAYLMLHQFVAPEPGHWVIQNAANSGVGQCLIRLAHAARVKSINVVRRPELVEPLRAYGGDVVLVDGPDLDKQVRRVIGNGSLRLAIDAVGGTATRRLAGCVQDNGVVVNYGVMSGEACQIEPGDIIFRNISLRGFWLRRWYQVAPPQEIANVYREVSMKIADGTLRVAVEKVYPFRKIKQALAHALRPGRNGKILLRFGAA